MIRRRHLWLIAAAALLGLAAWLLSRGEDAAPAPRAEKVHFPSRYDPDDVARAERRALPPAVDAGPRRPAGDPLLRTLVKGEPAVVFEANALRYSPIGELLLDCMRSRKENPLEMLKRDYGVDLTRDVDRVAMTGEGLVVTGHFQNVQWEKMLGALPESYGESGLVYPHSRLNSFPLPDGGTADTPESYARWGDDTFVIGNTRDGTQAILDRLDGKTQAPPALTPDQTYGEVYGSFTAADLARFLPPDQADLAEKLRTVAQEAEVHVDARGDVAMVMDLNGTDPAQVQDLAKSLGASLTLWRAQAKLQGQDQVAQLLDYASVAKEHGNGLQLELALPMAFLESQLAWCRPKDK